MTMAIQRKDKSILTRNGLFTDRYIRSLKPKEKMYQIREGRGFAIRVLPSGVKTWYYVYTISGKRRQLNLGNYPEILLSVAHEVYRSAVSLVLQGIDPQVVPEDLEIDLTSLTVAEVANLYISHIETYLHMRSVIQQRRTLAADVITAIGCKLARDIKRKDAIALIECVAKRAPGQARNVLKTARSMYSFALMREIVEMNPFSGIGKAVPVIAPRSRNRTLAEKEIVNIWNSVDSYLIGRALFLILLTGQRPGEVVGMKWDEIVDGKWWIIPEERSKNGKENRIYLTYAARLILPEKTCDIYVFPARGGGRALGAVGSMRPGTLSHYITKNKYFEIPRWTPHDLRRTMATGLASLGCSDEVIDEVLNHKKHGVISVYNRHNYDKEKRQWLRQWSVYVMKVVNNK